VCCVSFRRTRSRISLIAVDAQKTSAHFAQAGRNRIRQPILISQASRRLKQILVLSGTGERKMFEGWAREASVFGFEISLRLSERLCAQNLVGAFRADGDACTLPVAREVKMEIPAKASHPRTPSKDAEPRTSHSLKTGSTAHACVLVLVLIEPNLENKSGPTLLI
jgi:hypothetical protein